MIALKLYCNFLILYLICSLVNLQKMTKIIEKF